MRAVRRTLVLLACAALMPTIALAQAVIAGSVKDSSGAVLPGVNVEAASPELIERIRTAVTDGAGQYRIEDLRPGAYTVTFSLPGFTTLKREGIELTGTFTATINVELKVGVVAETVTVTGESPVVNIQSARREMTLNNDVLKAIPTVRSYNATVSVVPGVTTNLNDVVTATATTQFPIHGGRAGRIGDCRPGDERRAQDGRQQEIGRALHELHRQEVVRRQFQRRATGCRARGPDAALERVRRERVVRRSDQAGQSLVLPERTHAGQYKNHRERVLQPERGRPDQVAVLARSEPSGLQRSDVGERQWTRHVADKHAQQGWRFLGRAGKLPHVHGSHDGYHRSGARRARSPRPEPDETAPRHASDLVVALDEQAAPRCRLGRDLLRVGQFRASSESYARSDQRRRTMCRGLPGERRDSRSGVSIAGLGPELRRLVQLARVGVVRDRTAEPQGRIPGHLLERHSDLVHEQPESRLSIQ